MDFEKIALPGTIYNIFSDLVAEGQLRRVARGVYTRGTRDFTAGEVALVKARANSRQIVPLRTLSQDGLPFHIFSSDGRSTSFQLLEKGIVTGVVFFREHNRTTHNRKVRSAPPPSVAARPGTHESGQKHEKPLPSSESSTTARSSTALCKTGKRSSRLHNKDKTSLVSMLKGLVECLRQHELLLRRMLQVIETMGFP